MTTTQWITAKKNGRTSGEWHQAHTNTVEGFFSLLKRGIYGCYFHVSEVHLHRYLAEFDFRNSNRAKPGVDDTDRGNRKVRGAAGKRLTYRQPRGQAEEAGAAETALAG